MTRAQDEALDRLARDRDGFRLRGADMTRLETFTDAAFAFAVSLLVISVDAVPSSYDELMVALRGLPVFAASFAILMMFWWGHHRWSRRYGLEDLLSAVLSMALVFTVLSYVYPLKFMFALVTWWLSDGVLASEAALNSREELDRVIAIYSLGFTTMALVLVALNARALHLADALRLNERERLETRGDVGAWSLTAAVGAVSAALGLTGIGPPAGGAWVYMSMPFVMTGWAFYHAARVRRLEASETRVDPG